MMFNNLSRKQRWAITGLCLINSLVGIAIGWGVQYVHPPQDLNELQTEAWDQLAESEDLIDIVLNTSDVWEQRDLPKETWPLIHKVLLTAKAEIMSRRLTGWQVDLPSLE